jgi:glucosylceramidase
VVQQWGCFIANENQKWRIEPVSAGLYKLKAMHSGRLLTVGWGWANAANTRDGAPMVQWDDNTGSEQTFYIQASGTGYQLKNLNSGKCLDVSNVSTADGALLQQWTCATVVAQQFKLKALF